MNGLKFATIGVWLPAQTLSTRPLSPPDPPPVLASPLSSPEQPEAMRAMEEATATAGSIRLRPTVRIIVGPFVERRRDAA